MPRIKDMGKLDWNLEDKSGDLCLVLYLDNPPAKEGEVEESVVWDSKGSSKVWIRIEEREIELDLHDPQQHDLLRLPRELRDALGLLHLYIAGLVAVTYSWHGGKRVDIRISQYPKKILFPTAFLISLARTVKKCIELSPGVRLQEMMYADWHDDSIPPCPENLVKDAIEEFNKRKGK